MSQTFKNLIYIQPINQTNDTYIYWTSENVINTHSLVCLLDKYSHVHLLNTKFLCQNLVNTVYSKDFWFFVSYKNDYLLKYSWFMMIIPKIVKII